MKFGINTLLWTAGFDREHIPLLEPIKRHGFDAVEIARFSWDGFPFAEVRRELDRLQLEVTACSALTGSLSLVSEDSSVRAQAREFLQQGIAAAAQLGSKVLIGPFCAPVGYLPGRRRNQQEWRWAVEGLRSLGDTLDKHSITLAVEPLNRFETYFLNTTADAIALIDEVAHPRTGILFDTFHANIEDKSLPDAVRAAGHRITHVHACENDRGIPGSGHIDFPGVFQALHQTGYSDYAVIESFGFAIKEIAAAACIWRDLAATPEAIAWQGIDYLRKL
jgi:D-psicose/D-tagatose/L-ribulose 3-epimerase